MAHTAASYMENTPYARMKYVTYFCTDGSAVGGAATESTMSENFALGHPFELEKIRLRLSAGHVSIVDFFAYISHHLGDHFNHDLISQAMLGVSDVLWLPHTTLMLHGSDVIHFSMEYSAANIYGLEVSGWAVTVPSGG